jgi:hypothetical protein
MAHPKLNLVRQRFNFRCGYCGVSETDTGGLLTVDHFRPSSAGGTDDDDNLVYAFFRCNGYKLDFWPTDEDQNNGFVLLHPLFTDAAAHFEEAIESSLLLASTPTGEFQIRLLHLNRPELVAWRRRRRLLQMTLLRLDSLESYLGELELLLEEQRRYIELLEKNIHQ